jgi:hypothetical protein
LERLALAYDVDIGEYLIEEGGYREREDIFALFISSLLVRSGSIQLALVKSHFFVKIFHIHKEIL